MTRTETELPLRLRLPNPPAVFVGRETAVSWFVEAAGRAPVTVVAGPAGVGKTALVLQALHRRHRRRLGRVLFVSMTADEQPLTTVLQALSEATGAPTPQAPLTEHERLAGILALAEAGPWWVVLDDLGDTAVLDVLARYGRRSRWIATRRAAPELPALLGQVLVLPGLEDADLTSLATTCAPSSSAAERADAVSGAGGSPWALLRQLSFAGAGSTGPLDVPEGPERRALQVLAAGRVPLPTSVVSVALAVPAEPALEQAARWGLVARAGAEWRLHDIASRGLPVPPERVRRAVAAALGKAGSPNLTVASVGLWLELADVAEASKLLEEEGTRVLDAGWAPQLWPALRAWRGEPRLAGWRLRCAVALGDPAALRDLEAPAPGLHQDRALWARGLIIQGRLEEALTVASDVAFSANDPVLTEAAEVMACRALMNLGRFDEAWSLLAARSEPSPEAAVLGALCLVNLGRTEEALARARTLDRWLGNAPGLWDSVGFGLAQCLYQLGRLDEAHEVLERRSMGRSAELTIPTGRQLLLELCIELDRGDLERTRSLLLRAAPLLDQGSILSAPFALADVMLRYFAGPLNGVAADAEALARRGSTEERPDIVCYGRAAAHQLRRACGEEPPPETRLDQRDARLAFDALEAAVALRWLARWRRAPPWPTVAQLLAATAEHPEPSLLGGLAAADLSGLGGAAADAAQKAQAVMDLAETHGFRARKAEAGVARCSWLLIGGSIEALQVAATELQALTAVLPAARLQAQAAFMAAAAAANGPDLATLEALAAGASREPAARWASAVLGESVPLDAVDTMLVEATTARWAPAVLEVAGAENGPVLGLDARHLSAWRSDGVFVSLRDRPLLWAILEALWRGGASGVSKEQLVLGVWDETEYHPLRHDNRMQAAVRKLRRSVEPDPADPVFVLTTPDGYRLGGRVRRLGPAEDP